MLKTCDFVKHTNLTVGRNEGAPLLMNKPQQLGRVVACASVSICLVSCSHEEPNLLTLTHEISVISLDLVNWGAVDRLS